MMMNNAEEAAAAQPAVGEAPKAGGVADLERRLAMLGDDTANDPPPPMEVAEQSFAAPPAVAVAPAATGKNALLARIKAAQDRAKMAKPKTEEPPPPPPDIFDMAPPSAPPATASAPPPPAFDDTSFLAPPPPQQAEAPPSFSLLGDTFDMKPPPVEAAAVAPPSYAMAPPAPSAPAFEDLLGGGMPTAPPALMGGMEQLPPPPPMPVETQQPPPSASDIAEEFAGLEGLSPEMMEEQRRIMEEIEKNKSNKTASAADAFDLRSNAAVARIAGGESTFSSNSASASSGQQRTVKVGANQEVALHGQESTRAAIEDGTALLTQCVNCNNWMQVTDNATLMFCPVCQVVSPVDRENAVTTKEEALQMEADRKMAEELQNEEYTAAERSERRQRRAQQQQQAAAAKQDDSWWGWLGLGGSEATPATQSRPGASPTRAPGIGAALQPARTGEGGQWAPSGSYDGGENRSLLGSGGGGGGGARVAEAKPLFACVADSIATAASSVSTAMNTTTDEEGNVNGVDGSSLLVMSNAGRNQN